MRRRWAATPSSASAATPSTGALTQLGGGAGCIANAARPGCVTGRALDGPDGDHGQPERRQRLRGGVHRQLASRSSPATPRPVLSTQPSDTTGCLVETPTTGCTTGLALGNPEGVTVSPDGANVYVAAPGSNAVDTFARNSSTGALTQATDGTGCIVSTALAGCTTGVQLAGADAVAVSPDGASVYVTSLGSNSVTAFTRATNTGQLTQLTGTSACVINLLAVGCSLGRKLSGPEGLAVSPDGANVYVTAFTSGCARRVQSQRGFGRRDAEAARAGLSARAVRPWLPASDEGCSGASSVAVSPDGRNVYSAAFRSDSVGIFRRVTKVDDALTQGHERQLLR